MTEGKNKMAAAKIDLTIEQGVTLRHRYIWATGTKSNPVPVPMAGYTARAMFKASPVKDASRILSITKTNPAVVTTKAPHKLANGKSCVLVGAGGMTQINNVRAEVTKISEDKFSIAIDATAFGTFTNGGSVAYVSLTDVLSTEGQIILGAADGSIVTYIKDAVTDVMTGSGVYDIELIAPVTLDVIRRSEGLFTVSPGITG